MGERRSGPRGRGPKRSSMPQRHGHHDRREHSDEYHDMEPFVQVRPVETPPPPPAPVAEGVRPAGDDKPADLSQNRPPVAAAPVDNFEVRPKLSKEELM